MSLEVPACWELIVSMQAAECLSLEQIRAFLAASDEIGFKGRNREEVYGWVNQTLRQQRYQELKRRSRGLVRRYLEKFTGLSRAQMTRLITMYLEGEPVKPKAYRRRRFPKRYSKQDIELLATVDEAHETLSGPATCKILAAGLLRFWGFEISAVGGTFCRADVSAAQKPDVSAAADSVSANPSHAGGHR